MAIGELAKDAGYILPLKVLKSNAGYYIGTVSEFGEPISRESLEYFSSEDEANESLKSGHWTQREQMTF